MQLRPPPPHQLQVPYDLQGPPENEVACLREELVKLRGQVENLEVNYVAHQAVCRLMEELRSQIERHEDKDSAKSKELQEELVGARAMKEDLNEQLNQTQRALSDTLDRNSTLVQESDALRSSQLSLREELKRLKTCIESDRVSFAQSIADADDDCTYLNNRLDEMQELVQTHQADQEWYEAQLATSQLMVSNLSGELSGEQVVRHRLEEDLSAARVRGSNLNRWLLRTAQQHLEKSQSRNAELEQEIIRLRTEIPGIAFADEGWIDDKIGEVIRDALSRPAELEMTTQKDDKGPANINTAQFVVAADGVMEDTFVALSNRIPDLEDAKQISRRGIRSISVVSQDELVWAQCPDTAFFVKPAHCLGKGGVWKAVKNQSIKRLQKEGTNELIPHFSGAYYYVGTYIVGGAQTLSRAEFEQLSSKVQRALILSSGKANKYQELREMYFSGKLKALRYPVFRTGYNTKLYDYLRHAISI